jgi:hypothetical protein
MVLDRPEEESRINTMIPRKSCDVKNRKFTHTVGRSHTHLVARRLPAEARSML